MVIAFQSLYRSRFYQAQYVANTTNTTFSRTNLATRFGEKRTLDDGSSSPFNYIEADSPVNRENFSKKSFYLINNDHGGEYYEN